MSPIPTHYHVDQASLLPLLTCHFSSQQWELLHPNWLNFQFWHMCAVVSELLTHRPRKPLHQLEYMLTCSSFAFMLTDSTHFQISTLFSHPFSEAVSFIYDTARFFCHILRSLLGSPDLLNDFFNFAYIKVYSLWQMLNILYSPLQYHTK